MAEPDRDAGAVLGAPPEANVAATTDEAYSTELLQGRVVWLYPEVQERLGISIVREASERVLALATAEDRWMPILEDTRGRAFRRDKRLRDRPVELLVRRHPQLPMIQIVKLWFVKEDGRYAVDYWCDVCAISMIEDGPCDCCQQPNRLRETKQ